MASCSTTKVGVIEDNLVIPIKHIASPIELNVSRKLDNVVQVAHKMNEMIYSSNSSIFNSLINLDVYSTNGYFSPITYYIKPSGWLYY
ncbi:hypothetical protein THF1C08_90096 [Vibrio jasicida]|uniref:Uncharacterized protein n=1 Tax=Vibrio jasicida TaxID=766224 RepID=A0AAU9QX87_9VIBR|nr:hypothetical protein THF1C08_90096 [Vibrio jasicida]CAH1603716.1 hypothetical protein THF1A12_80094 [Vibrio jasicida]